MRGRAAIVALIALLAVACKPVAETRPKPAPLVGDDAEQFAYSQADANKLHKTLRGAAGLPEWPGGTAVVRVAWITHMPQAEYSLVAIRGKDHWTVETITDDPRAPDLAPPSKPLVARLNSAAERQLNDLVDGEALYEEPIYFAHNDCFDGHNVIVQIRTASRSWSALQLCRTEGLTGKLVDLINAPLDAQWNTVIAKRDASNHQGTEAGAGAARKRTPNGGI